MRSSFSGDLSHPLPTAESLEDGGEAFNGKHTGNCVDDSQLHDHGYTDSAGSQPVEHKQGIETNSLWKKRIGSVLLWAGKKSLEIYMIHGLLLNILMPEIKPVFPSIAGYGLITGNFMITILLCAIVISLLSQNRILKKILGMK